jgi:hypothetical protein
MKFIALPVTQGDAFYAERADGFRVLVDGGRSRRALPELFRRYTRSGGVDVLVCTHNDADHAEGVIGFLESGLDCQELWLPDTWVDALQSVPSEVQHTLRFVWERFESEKLELERLPGEGEGDVQKEAWQAVFPESLGRQLEGEPEEASAAEGDAGPICPSSALSDVVPAIEEYLEVTPQIITGGWRWLFLYRYGDMRDALLSTVLKDMRRLLELARLALDRGVPVRCFRHAPLRAAGVSGCPLIPLSGRNVKRIAPVAHRRDAETFWRLLHLTTVNRESLVCYLEGLDGEPGVLFTADSDLKDMGLERVQEWSVATAPHHGSRDNRDAYSRVGKPMVWVRSDGYSRVRPCGEFLSAAGKRFCTLCRKGSRPKQAVRLYLRETRWVRWGTLPCCCN